MTADWYRWDDDVLWLSVYVQPRASRDEIVGPHGDALKIRLAAPPVEGQANAQLIRFLAKTFGVARSQIQLAAGANGRHKRLRILRPQRDPATLVPGT